MMSSLSLPNSPISIVRSSKPYPSLRVLHASESETVTIGIILGTPDAVVIAADSLDLDLQADGEVFTSYRRKAVTGVNTVGMLTGYVRVDGVDLIARLEEILRSRHWGSSNDALNAFLSEVSEVMGRLGQEASMRGDGEFLDGFIATDSAVGLEYMFFSCHNLTDGHWELKPFRGLLQYPLEAMGLGLTPETIDAMNSDLQLADRVRRSGGLVPFAQTFVRLYVEDEEAGLHQRTGLLEGYPHAGGSAHGVFLQRRQPPQQF